jgi:hypothetical protein
VTPLVAADLNPPVTSSPPKSATSGRYLQKSMLAMIGNAQRLDWADANTGRRSSSLANRTNEVLPRNFPSPVREAGAGP